MAKIECVICTEIHKCFDTPCAEKHQESPTCRRCYRTYIMDRAKQGQTIICMHCSTELGLTYVQKVLKPAQFEEYQELAVRNVLNQSNDVFQCPTPNCSGIFFVDEKSTEVVCSSCHKKYCFQCKVFWHIDETCSQYQKRIQKLASDNPEEQSLKAIKMSSKPCPKCKTQIAKNGGCKHMTCTKCKYQFHWDTGFGWKSNKADFPLPKEYTNIKSTEYDIEEEKKTQRQTDVNIQRFLIEEFIPAGLPIHYNWIPRSTIRDRIGNPRIDQVLELIDTLRLNTTERNYLGNILMISTGLTPLGLPRINL